MAAEAGRPEDLVGLAQKLLGSSSLPWAARTSPRASRVVESDDDVRGTDRLARLEREPLGVVEPPLGEQHLGEQALALDQRAPISEGLEDADGLAQESPRACCRSSRSRAPMPSQLSVRPRVMAAPLSAKSDARLLERLLGVGEPALDQPPVGRVARRIQPRVVGLPLSPASSIARCSGSCARSDSRRAL